MTPTNQFRFAITNTETGDVLEVVDCPKKAIAVAFNLSGIKATLTHGWSKADQCWLLTLHVEGKEPEPIACSYNPDAAKALENMIGNAMININFGGYIKPLHIDYDVVIRDIARSTSTDRIYVWFGQGIADFAAVIEPSKRHLSVNWTADLTHPDKHWLDLSPPVHQWAIKLLLGAAGISEVDGLKRDPAKFSWSWAK